MKTPLTHCTQIGREVMTTLETCLQIAMGHHRKTRIEDSNKGRVQVLLL